MRQFFRVYVARRLISWARYLRSLFRSGGRASEFHYFPFDTTLPMPAGADRLMAKLCDVLAEVGVCFRITDGTVLGLYRDKGFIPHDNDIDIDVLDCTDPAPIRRRMSEAGMTLGRGVVRDGLVQQLTYYSAEHIVFDLVFWHTRGSEVENYSEPGYLRTQPAFYFHDLDHLHWQGRDYPVPSQLEQWLVFRYGEDWNIPKRSKGDWKLECHDLVKL